MEDISEAFETYRTTFPSDVFLRKYYGRSRRLKRILRSTFLPLFGQRESLNQYLRRKFDVMRIGAMELIRMADRAEHGFEPIYVFKDDHCSDWVHDALKARDLNPELTLDAEADLCLEFITQFRQGAFYEDSWWQWFAEDGTIGIRIRNDALQSGGNRTRTLEVFMQEGTEID